MVSVFPKFPVPPAERRIIAIRDAYYFRCIECQTSINNYMLRKYITEQARSTIIAYNRYKVENNPNLVRAPGQKEPLRISSSNISC